MTCLAQHVRGGHVILIFLGIFVSNFINFVRFVYFQASCNSNGPSVPSVGIELSTPEMPLRTLVGASSNSVGLCSTDQVTALTASVESFMSWVTVFK